MGDAATGEVAMIAGGAIEAVPWTDDTINCSFKATCEVIDKLMISIDGSLISALTIRRMMA